MSPTPHPKVWTCQTPLHSTINSASECTLSHPVQPGERSLSWQRTSPPQEEENPKPRCPLTLGSGQAFSLFVPPPPSDLISYGLFSLSFHHPGLLACLEYGFFLGTLAVCCGLNICVNSKSLCWGPNPQKWWYEEVRPSWMTLEAYKRGSRRTPSPSAMWRHMASLWPGRGHSSDHTGTLVSGSWTTMLQNHED